MPSYLSMHAIIHICMSTVNVIMLLTRMGKFMYMQAWLTNSIVICMLAWHVTTLKHCHIVAMGMTVFQLPNSLSSAKPTLEVLSIKHCRQSTFAKMPSTTRHSRDARQRRASMLVIYIYEHEAAQKPISENERNKYFELKNSWGANGVPQTRTTC